MNAYGKNSPNLNLHPHMKTSRKKNRKILTYKIPYPKEKNTILRELPQADKKTRRITIDGEDFVTINRLAKELGISHRVVSTAADDVSSFEARGVGGEKLLSTKNRNLERNSRIFSLCFRRTRKSAESPKTERVLLQSIVWQKSSVLVDEKNLKHHRRRLVY